MSFILAALVAVVEWHRVKPNGDSVSQAPAENQNISLAAVVELMLSDGHEAGGEPEIDCFDVDRTGGLNGKLVCGVGTSADRLNERQPVVTALGIHEHGRLGDGPEQRIVTERRPAEDVAAWLSVLDRYACVLRLDVKIERLGREKPKLVGELPLKFKDHLFVGGFRNNDRRGGGLDDRSRAPI